VGSRGAWKFCRSHYMRLLGAMGWCCCSVIEQTTIVCEQGAALMWPRVVEILSRCADVQLRNRGSVGVTVPVCARLLFKRHRRRGNCTCTVAGRDVFAATWGGAHLRAACKLVSAGSVIYSPLLRRCYATTGNGRYNCPASYTSPPGDC
jgi:hypothetical protein